MSQINRNQDSRNLSRFFITAVNQVYWPFLFNDH